MIKSFNYKCDLQIYTVLKRRHTWLNLKKKLNLQQFDEISEEAFKEVNANLTEVEHDWYMDSGASSHITGNRAALTSFTPSTSSTPGPQQMGPNSL